MRWPVATGLRWGAALLGVALLFYGRFLMGRLPVGADQSLMYAPFYALRWSEGPPLWDQYLASGMGLLTNLQAALLYPMRWPFYFIADWRAYFGVFNFLHYVVALAGAAVWGRELALRPVGIWTLAVLFGVGGHMAGRIINPTIFYACCWLPWLLAGASGAARRHGWLTTLGAAMILTTGSPHLMFYGALGYATVAATVGLARARLPMQPRGARRWAWRQALHGVMALLLAAPTLVPGVLAVPQSIRTEADVRTNLADSMRYDHMPLALLGGTGGPIHPEYIDRSAYVGAPAVLLALGLLMRRASWRDRRVWAAVALVALGFWFALGFRAGVHWIMPWVPGFNRLAAASRAMVLTAAGMALLAALAVEQTFTPRRARALAAVGLLAGGAALAGFLIDASGRAIPGFDPPFASRWMAFYGSNPSCLTGWRWVGIDAGWSLLAMSILLLLLVRSRVLPWSLSGLVLIQLAHFAPRVAPPTEPPAFFDPPANVQWLMARAQEPEPFRIAGFDPLRLYDGDFYNRHTVALLMPNLATLYGLEDIQGFDPLIRRWYVALFLATAGRAPYNDPIHNLDVDRPDPRLFRTLNVRYLIGHPYDRRLTTIPQVLRADQPSAPVAAWSERGTGEPIVQWAFVALLDGALPLPQGAEVARLRVDAEEGSFEFPLRNGIESADVAALNLPPTRRPASLDRLLNTPWTLHTPTALFGDRLKQANYRGRIDFGRPLHVRALEWRLTDPNVVVYLAGQAYRLASPAQDPLWRRVWGDDDDPAVIYEFLDVRPRAVVVDVDRPAVTPKGNLIADWDALEQWPAAGRVEWLNRALNRIRLAVDAERPAFLIMRDTWDTLWRATVDGRATEVLSLNNLMRAVRVPPGRHEVEFRYRPPAFWAGAWIAAALLAAGLMRRGSMAI